MRNHTRNFDSAYVIIEASHERGVIMLKSLKIFSIFVSLFLRFYRSKNAAPHYTWYDIYTYRYYIVRITETLYNIAVCVS